MDLETYTPGHGANSTEFMARRSLSSHGAFFLPEVKSGLRILDCGCGPGSITLDLARRVAPAEAVGVDSAPTQIERARADAARQGVVNVRFSVASCYDLPFENGTFDRVFSHALFEHLAQPLKALSEIHRVLRPGGAVGICSPDWGGFVLAPHSPEVDRAIDAYVAMQKGNGGDVLVGRKLGEYLARSGFDSIQMHARYECYTSLPVIGEYLALQLEGAGQSRAAEVLRNWSGSPGGLFAQAWISAVGRK